MTNIAEEACLIKEHQIKVWSPKEKKCSIIINVSHESKLKLYKPNLTSYSFNVIKHVV